MGIFIQLKLGNKVYGLYPFSHRQESLFSESLVFYPLHTQLLSTRVEP
jgi:hypothetical protein